MTKLQAGPFHDVHRRTIIEKIRFVRPDVAVVITTIVDRHGNGPPAETRGTFVLSKEENRWLLNSFQNTQIPRHQSRGGLLKAYRHPRLKAIIPVCSELFARAGGSGLFSNRFLNVAYIST